MKSLKNHPGIIFFGFVLKGFVRNRMLISVTFRGHYFGLDEPQNKE